MRVPSIHPQTPLLSLPRPSSPCLCASLTPLSSFQNQQKWLVKREATHPVFLALASLRERPCLTRACWVASFESDVAPCLPDPSLEMVLGEPDTRSQSPHHPAFVSGRNKITLGKVQPSPPLPPNPGLGYSFPIHSPLPASLRWVPLQERAEDTAAIEIQRSRSNQVWPFLCSPSTILTSTPASPGGVLTLQMSGEFGSL